MWRSRAQTFPLGTASEWVIKSGHISGQQRTQLNATARTSPQLYITGHTAQPIGREQRMFLLAQMLEDIYSLTHPIWRRSYGNAHIHMTDCSRLKNAHLAKRRFGHLLWLWRIQPTVGTTPSTGQWMPVLSAASALHMCFSSPV